MRISTKTLTELRTELQPFVNADLQTLTLEELLHVFETVVRLRDEIVTIDEQVRKALKPSG